MTAASPRLRIESECRRVGADAFILRCNAMLAGQEESPEFILVLGGRGAQQLLGAESRGSQEYWLRVWAARGLLWAGVGDDTTALQGALHDEHWRVREMACKVVARHRVGDLLDDVAVLRADGTARVRAAAARAAMRIIESAA
jgi:hypothetical protein